jgi:hypothetical protein
VPTALGLVLAQLPLSNPAASVDGDGTFEFNEIGEAIQDGARFGGCMPA